MSTGCPALSRRFAAMARTANEAKLRRQLAQGAALHARGVLTDVEYAVLAVGTVCEAILDRPINPGEGTPDEIGVSAWVALADVNQGLDGLGPLRQVRAFAEDVLGSPRPGARGMEGPAWTGEAQRILRRVRVRLRPHNAAAAYLEHWLSEQHRAFPRLFGFLGTLVLSAATFVLGLLLGLLLSA